MFLFHIRQEGKNGHVGFNFYPLNDPSNFGFWFFWKTFKYNHGLQVRITKGIKKFNFDYFKSPKTGLVPAETCYKPFKN